MPGPCDTAASEAIGEHVAASLDHVGQAGAHGAPDAEQVDLDGALERRGIHGPHHARRGDTRVGHHHIDAAETLDGRVHGLAESVDVRDVRFEGRRVRAALLGHARKLLRLEAHEGQVRAAGGRLAGGLRPDAPRGSGDENCPALQVHVGTLSRPR